MALTQQREGQCGGFRHPGPFAQGRGHGTERRQRPCCAPGLVGASLAALARLAPNKTVSGLPSLD